MFPTYEKNASVVRMALEDLFHRYGVDLIIEVCVCVCMCVCMCASVSSSLFEHRALSDLPG